MKHLLLIVAFLVSTTSIFASSILGGDLTYERVGSTSFKVQLKLYRDCTVGSSPFATSVKIKVRKGQGVITGLNFDMPLDGVSQTSLPIDSCSYGTCVEEAIYTETVTLPPEVEGYHLFYVACCRDGGIDNIMNPTNTGEVINTFIPNTINWVNNSSPSWSNSPEVVVCKDQNFNFDHSATDSDGDSLVYSLYAPYSDTIPLFNNSNPTPNNILFSPVTWASGFSETSPFNNSGTVLSINSTTGVLTGMAEDVGQFIVGVKCQEYRDGILIGEIVRDFQYQVFDCSASKEAKIGHLNGCNGNIIEMVNESPSGASDFYWDFGDASTGSTDYEPTHNFPGTGNFTVTLISQYGTPCADTTTQILKIGVVFAHIDPIVDSTCITDAVNFSENSQAYGDMTIDSLLWKFGDSTSSTDPNPNHTFSESGNLMVKLIVGTDAGCFDSIMKPIYVQGLPLAEVGSDTAACFGNPEIPLNGVVINATGGTWTGSGGSFAPASNDLNATYFPSNAEITAGFTELTLLTTGNGLCASSSSTLHVDFIDQPLIDVGPDLIVCGDTAFIPLNANTQFSNGVEWYTTNGTGSLVNPLTENAIYVPSVVDLSKDSIVLIAQTTNNGGCNQNSDTLTLKLISQATIGFIYTDTICEHDIVHLNAYSSTGVSGVWSTNGDGTFSTPTLHITDYTPGTGDLNAQNIKIYFETTNNGLCSPQYDTLDVVIVPNPSVDFTFDQVCMGTPTELTSTITSTIPTSDYSWHVNNIPFSSHEDTSFVFPNDTNEVTFIAYTPQGCSDTVVKTITPFPSPVANFNVDNPCSNSITQFIDSSYNIGGTLSGWAWDFGDNSVSSNSDPQHTYTAGGNYNVQLIVTSPDNCIDSITKPLSIYTGPTAGYSATPIAASAGDAITFVDLSTTGSTIDYWEWNFDDGDYSYNQNTSHSYNNGGKYDVSLYVQDINDCVDSTVHTVIIRVEPMVPSAFSPNNDGNNDFLKIFGGPYKTLDFKVFNNWGEVIFQTDDSLEGWDGTYNGKLQPVGIYIWTLKATTNSGVEYEMSGDVSLIR